MWLFQPQQTTFISLFHKLTSFSKGSAVWNLPRQQEQSLQSLQSQTLKPIYYAINCNNRKCSIQLITHRATAASTILTTNFLP